MKKMRIALIAIALLVPVFEASAGYVNIECSCKCKGIQINKTGVSQIGLTAVSAANKSCNIQCAKTCGGWNDYAGSKKTCSENCDTFCNDSSGGYNGSEQYRADCQTACSNPCVLRGTMSDITGIIYTIAGVIGAIMLAINGIRLVTSTDSNTRDAAKTSMMYVLIALLVIALSGAAVTLFMGMGR